MDEDARPEAAPEETAPKHGHRCREAVGLAMHAFLDLLDQSVEGDTISVDAVRRIAQAVIRADGALGAYFDVHSAACIDCFELALVERQRANFFGRAITKRLTPLFEDENSGFQRKNLPQFFSAVRMILGDPVYGEYSDRCASVVNELRGGDEFVPWEKFYIDERVAEVVELTLVAIARSFRRFAPRKDWFLIVMNMDPHAVSLASNVFMPKSNEQKLDHLFDEAAFLRLFERLFDSVRPERYDSAESVDFSMRHGASPAKLFGPLWIDLRELEQALARVPVHRHGPGIEPRNGAKPK